MFRRSLIIGLAGCGLLAIALGAQKWLETRAARGTVHALMQALIAGDQQAVLQLLTVDKRAETEARLQEGASALNLPQGPLDYRIRQIELHGDAGWAKLQIEREGFALKPVVHLQRTATSSWKISGIDNVQIDPRWNDLQRLRAQQQDGQLAEELRAALKDRPGVTVERADVPPVR